MKTRLTQQRIAAYRSLGSTEERLQVQSQQTTGSYRRPHVAIVDCTQAYQTAGSYSRLQLQVAYIDYRQPQYRLQVATQTAGSHSTLQVAIVHYRQPQQTTGSHMDCRQPKYTTDSYNIICIVHYRQSYYTTGRHGRLQVAIYYQRVSI